MSFDKARSVKRTRVVTATMLAKLGDKLLTKAEIYRVTGVSERQIGRLVAAGKLVPINTVGARDKFAPDDVRRLLIGVNS